MQLTVTPRVEGVLQIVGVKWKLSDFVVGFHNFDTRPVKIIGKQRQKANHPLSINLKFAVVKVNAPSPSLSTFRFYCVDQVGHFLFSINCVLSNVRVYPSLKVSFIHYLKGRMQGMYGTLCWS